MPRKAVKSVPGTERFRDERRKDGGPRIHGRQWHDHDEPRDLERASMAGAGAVPDVADGSGERKGMNRSRKTSGTGGREKRKRSVPIGKGVMKPAYGSKRGKAGALRPTGTRTKAFARKAQSKR